MTLFFSLYHFSEYSNNLMSKRTVARAPRGDCIGCFLTILILYGFPVNCQPFILLYFRDTLESLEPPEKIFA